ncbi:hypothetical protein HDU92_005718 [Lobulomyces angularis]|nr:hypothetical protein HDU92_005718 [Lobulomyces angularis]
MLILILNYILFSKFILSETVKTYQLYNGSSSNPLHNDWGAVHQHLLWKQVLPRIDYDDNKGVYDSEKLPSARFITNLMREFEETNFANEGTTEFLPNWGMVMHMDLLESESRNLSDPFPIIVPKGDPHFDPSVTGNIVLPFFRSPRNDALAEKAGGKGYIQIKNLRTAVIDGSGLYGMDEMGSNSFRLGVDGLFDHVDGINGEFPIKNDSTGLWNFPALNAQLTPTTSVIHICLFREHNRRARLLKERHPFFTDEELFQNARRWVIALIQKITYDQYLPSLIGEALPTYAGFDPKINPGIDMFFAGCSYRYAHGATNSIILRVDENGDTISQGHLLLRDSIFDIESLISLGIEPVLRGMAITEEQLVDLRYVEDLRSELKNSIFNGHAGFDLQAASIQRSRELGIPKYNFARFGLNLSRSYDFSDISSNLQVQSVLKKIYGTVDNVEAFIGGLAEDHFGAATVGPLFQASIKEQYIRIRSGDAFWYENPGVLSELELAEIKEMSLGKLITLNSKIKTFTANPFRFQHQRLNILSKASNGNLKSREQADESNYSSLIKFNENLIVNYVLNDDESLITFRIFSNYTGWFAFGFGNSMDDLDLFLFKNSNGSWNAINGISNGVGIVKEISPGNMLETTEITPVELKENFLTVFSFSRNLTSIDERFVTLTRKNHWVSYSGSMDVWPNYHGINRGSVSVNFFLQETSLEENGSSGETSKSRVSTLKFHGLFMAILFGVCFPVGVFAAKYYTDSASWLKIHQFIMSIIVSDTLVTAGTAFASNFDERKTAHSIIGLYISFIITTVSFTGISTFLIGVVNMYLGASSIIKLDTKLPENLPNIVIVIPILIFVLGSFLGEIRKSRLEKLVALKGEVKSTTSNYHILPTYSWEDVNARIQSGCEKWIIIEDVIYDVKAYLNRHPGGVKAIEAMIGMEAGPNFYYKPKRESKKSKQEEVDKGGRDSKSARKRASVICKTSDIEASALATPTNERFSISGGDTDSSNLTKKEEDELMENFEKHNHSNLAILILGGMAIGKIETPNEPKESIIENTLGILSRKLSKKVGTAKKKSLVISIDKDIFKPTPFKNYILKIEQPQVLMTKDKPHFKIYKVKILLPRSKTLQIAPGKHISLVFLNAKGEVISRSYTPVRYLNKEFIEFYIKNYVGQMTTHLATATSIRCIFPAEPEKMKSEFQNPNMANGCWKNLGLIAGGTGLTFMLNLLEYHLYYLKNSDNSEEERNIVLYNLNNTKDNIFGCEHLEYLKRAFNLKGLFKIIHHVSNACEDFEGESGKVDGKRLKEAFPFAEVENSAVFICGPPEMTNKMSNLLINEGFPSSMIHKSF